MRLSKNLKYNDVFKNLMRLIMGILFIYYFINNNSIYFLNALLVIFVSLVPDVFFRVIRIRLSNTADFVVQLFIFLSMVLGRMYEFYEIFPWWDLFLHFSSGIIIGLAAVLVLKVAIEGDIYEKLSPLFIALFIFVFSTAGAGIWEIWEFAGDQLFGLDSQLNSLIDTMTDICMGAGAGLLTAIMGYYHCKKGKFKFIGDLKLEKIETKN